MTNVVIGAIAGIISYVITKYIDRIIATPRLKIVLDTTHTAYEFKPRERSGDGSDEGGNTFAVYRFKIINESMYIAKSCRVFLAKIDYTNTSIPNCTPLFLEGRQLRWSTHQLGTDVKGVDVPKGIAFYCELLEVEAHGILFSDSSSPLNEEPTENHDVQLKVATVSRAGLMYPRINADAEYTFSLVVTADNAEPYFATFNLKPRVLRHAVFLSLKDFRGEYRAPLLKLIETLGKI